MLETTPLVFNLNVEVTSLPMIGDIQLSSSLIELRDLVVLLTVEQLSIVSNLIFFELILREILFFFPFETFFFIEEDFFPLTDLAFLIVFLITSVFGSDLTN